MPDGYPDHRIERVLLAVSTMEKSLEILAEKRVIDREAYKRERETRDVVERRFVKMTEAAIDIGEELLKAERGRPAESNPATMLALVDVGVFSEAAGQEMAEAARFRNVLAHTYGVDIDDDLVYDALGDLERYRRFVHAVRGHLESVGALE